MKRYGLADFIVQICRLAFNPAVVMVLWNIGITHAFGLRELSFGQAMSLWLLYDFLSNKVMSVIMVLIDMGVSMLVGNRLTPEEEKP